MARRTSARVLETGSRVQVLCLHATCPTFRAQTVATTGCGCSFSGPKVLPCGRSFYSKGVCFYGMEDYCTGPILTIRTRSSVHVRLHCAVMCTRYARVWTFDKHTVGTPSCPDVNVCLCSYKDQGPYTRSLVTHAPKRVGRERAANPAN